MLTAVRIAGNIERDRSVLAKQASVQRNDIGLGAAKLRRSLGQGVTIELKWSADPSTCRPRSAAQYTFSSMVEYACAENIVWV